MSEYTDEQKAEATALYSEVGPSEVERRLGIPKGTVTGWAKAEGRTFDSQKTAAATAQSVEIRKSRLAEGLLDDAEKLRAQLFDATKVFHFDKDGDFHDAELDQPTFADQKNIMTALAIAVDKLQLLTGGATQRSDDMGRVELETKLAQFDELAVRRKVVA